MCIVNTYQFLEDTWVGNHDDVSVVSTGNENIVVDNN